MIISATIRNLSTTHLGTHNLPHSSASPINPPPYLPARPFDRAQFSAHRYVKRECTQRPSLVLLYTHTHIVAPAAYSSTVLPAAQRYSPRAPYNGDLEIGAPDFSDFRRAHNAGSQLAVCLVQLSLSAHQLRSHESNNSALRYTRGGRAHARAYKRDRGARQK